MLYSTSLQVIHFKYSSVYVSIPNSPYPSVCPLRVCFHFVNKFICIILFFLDSIYEQYHTIFLFLCLTYFTQYDNSVLKSLSCVQLFVTHGLYIACQAPWNSPGKSTVMGSLPFSRGSSWPQDQSGSPASQADFFTIWATREALTISRSLHIAANGIISFFSMAE